MKKGIALIITLFVLFSFTACSSRESAPPDELFHAIEKSYGKLSAGSFFDSRAKEWEENYLDGSVIESIFGSEESYKKAVESGYMYLSSSLTCYEEIVVLECYTSDKARRMAGVFSERDRMLGKLEEKELAAQIICKGRVMVYCRLANTSRAKAAVRAIED